MGCFECECRNCEKHKDKTCDECKMCEGGILIHFGGCPACKLVEEKRKENE